MYITCVQLEALQQEESVRTHGNMASGARKSDATVQKGIMSFATNSLALILIDRICWKQFEPIFYILSSHSHLQITCTNTSTHSQP